ncbi:MAG: hypothetical protein KatS3mg102_1901 [Planctomycetota bacterium]|nr:MAG: hypothetical protein KatS3mg102_1901 [Planctomycetota bacterium]
MIEQLLEYLPVLWRIALVAIGVGMVIFVHELGHFAVAKWVGIRVHVFSLGFGPRLFGWRRGETDYRVSLIPLGGYVAMAGESPDEPHSGAPDEFSSKSVGARAAVISAGVIMNLIFAVVGFLVAFKIGVSLTAPMVGAVAPGSPASGVLQRGDRIVEIDGEQPLDFVEVSLAAAFAGEQGLEMKVDRAGELLRVHLVPRKDLGEEFQRIGIEPIEEIARIEPGSAAARAGLEPGDRILGVEGYQVDSLAALSALIYDNPGRPLLLRLWRDGRRLTLTLVPEARTVRSLGLELSPLPVVREVRRGAPAARAGLQVGDLVLRVNEEPAHIGTVVERIKALAASPAPTIRMTVLRGGEERTIEITPLKEQRGGPVIGAGFGVAHIAAVVPDSPAARAGITPGARLLQLGEARGFARPEHLEQLVSVHQGEAVRVVWLDPSGERHEAQLEPVPVPGRNFGYAGFEVAPATFVLRAPGLLEPVALGFHRTWVFLKQVFLTLGGMLAGRIEPSTLGGPILIGKHAYDVAARGIGVLLYFLCLISVNLAVLNILPVPLLDGGHLVFLLVEWLKGSPVSPRVQAALQWTGLVVLVALMLYVTRNDILRLASG